jgi:SRSO17 transposase
MKRPCGGRCKDCTNTRTPQDLAMIIVQQPRSLQAFFAPFRSSLSKPQFHHLWTLVLAWVINLRRSALWHLARCSPDHGHRTSLGWFLSRSSWDGSDLLEQQVQRTLLSMRPRPGERLYLLIDDTRIAKRGRQIYGVGPIWVPTLGIFTYGNVVVTAAVEFRGVVLPWRFQLWVPRKQAGRSYRKATQIAAEFIRSFTPPPGLRVSVLFDAFYLTPVVVRACEDRGFFWFSVASKNRTLRRTDRRGRPRIMDLAPGLLKHQGHSIRLQRARGSVLFRIAVVDGRLKGIGSVRMVLRKRPGEPTKRITAIVTNDDSLNGRKIVSIYERRWQIEELFKELRSDLGLGQYQVISREGILHHLHLCGLVHLLLTHHSLEAVGAQTRKANHEVHLPPMNQRLDSLRRLIHQDHIRRLLAHVPDARRRKNLERYLLAA